MELCTTTPLDAELTRVQMILDRWSTLDPTTLGDPAVFWSYLAMVRDNLLAFQVLQFPSAPDYEETEEVMYFIGRLFRYLEYLQRMVVKVADTTFPKTKKSHSLFTVLVDTETLRLQFNFPVYAIGRVLDWLEYDEQSNQAQLELSVLHPTHLFYLFNRILKQQTSIQNNLQYDYEKRLEAGASFRVFLHSFKTPS